MKQPTGQNFEPQDVYSTWTARRNLMPTTKSTFLLWVFIIINLSLSIWTIITQHYVTVPHHHSYVGNDYPLELPVGRMDIVAMTLQETVHYSLNLSDPVSNAEWESMPDSIAGFGRTRLGPDYRLFVVTMHHQLHCLRYIQLTLFDPTDPEANMGHVHHCLNYLRQTLLCEANESIEEGDFLERDFDKDRLGATLVCLDWQSVYDDLDIRFEDWKEWRNTWN